VRVIQLRKQGRWKTLPFVTRRRPYPELGMRHACEPAFWANLVRATDFWISHEPLQYYETTGADRFCAVATRLARAIELAMCYGHTADLVADVAPAYYWQLKGKGALYRSVGGEWRGAIAAALKALRAAHHSVQNLAIALACLAGPSVSRWLLRLRGGRP
jgi:hypothetical protein